jgi:excisionase family DNA binding protein
MESALSVPPELLDAIADRVAERLAARLPDRPKPWLNAQEAAQHLACPKSRIYELVERGILTPHRDGRRLLFRASELDAALTETTDKEGTR